MFPFTYSLNIYWTPTMCQALDQILGIWGVGNRTGSCTDGTNSLVTWSPHFTHHLQRFCVSISRGDLRNQGFFKNISRSQNNCCIRMFIGPSYFSSVRCLFFPLPGFKVSLWTTGINICHICYKYLFLLLLILWPAVHTKFKFIYNQFFILCFCLF